MTTETPPAIDPTIEAWSDRLEADLVEHGMEQAQAHAYRQAFELGLARIMSVVATKQELFLTKEELRQEMRDFRDQLQREMEIRFDAMNDSVNARFAELNARLDRIERRWWAVVGVVVALQAGLYALLGVLLTR